MVREGIATASVGSALNVNPGLNIYIGKGGRAWFPNPDHFDSPNGLSAAPLRIAAGFVDGDGSEDLLVAESDNFVPFYNNSSQAGNPCTFPSSPGLHLCLPSGNSASPVHFIGNYHAEAQPANRIELWLDGQKMFQVFSNRLDTSLPVANGTHQVTLVGVDSAGRLIKSSQDFTVGASGGPCMPLATAGVVICTPADGSTVDNPVSISGAARSARIADIAERMPNRLVSYEAAQTTERLPRQATITGLPRSCGSSRCSTEAYRHERFCGRPFRQ